MDIISLTKGFKEISEWTVFCQAQAKQITLLTQELNVLKTKNKELESLLSKTVPLIQDPNQKLTTIQSVEGLTDEEAIAVMEIAKLKTISLDRPLDAVETKQYEIYTKTLQLLRQIKKSKEKDGAEKLSDEQILKLVEPDLK